MLWASERACAWVCACLLLTLVFFVVFVRPSFCFFNAFFPVWLLEVLFFLVFCLRVCALYDIGNLQYRGLFFHVFFFYLFCLLARFILCRYWGCKKFKAFPPNFSTLSSIFFSMLLSFTWFLPRFLFELLLYILCRFFPFAAGEATNEKGGLKEYPLQIGCSDNQMHLWMRKREIFFCVYVYVEATYIGVHGNVRNIIKKTKQKNINGNINLVHLTHNHSVDIGVSSL